MTKPMYPPYTGTERELLEAHLEHNRLAVRHKVEGLSLDLLRDTLVILQLRWPGW